MVHLQLFIWMVSSMVSFGAEVWSMQLTATAGGSTDCAAEHCALPSSATCCSAPTSWHAPGHPSLVVLADTCAHQCPTVLKRLLCACWLLRAAHPWNRLLAAGNGNSVYPLFASAALAATPGSGQPVRQPWDSSWQQAKLSSSLAAAGVQHDLANPSPCSLAVLIKSCQAQQLQHLQEVASRPSASCSTTCWACKAAIGRKTACGNQKPT